MGSRYPVAKDRAIPFSLSIPLSHLERLERVLGIAAQQGRLTGDAHRPNKLAAEALMQLAVQWEAEFRAQGLLAPAPSAQPALSPTPAPINAGRLAADPVAREQARRAGGFSPASTFDADGSDDIVLPEPPGINWDKVK